MCNLQQPIWFYCLSFSCIKHKNIKPRIIMVIVAVWTIKVDKKSAQRVYTVLYHHFYYHHFTPSLQVSLTYMVLNLCGNWYHPRIFHIHSTGRSLNCTLTSASPVFYERHFDWWNVTVGGKLARYILCIFYVMTYLRSSSWIHRTSSHCCWRLFLPCSISSRPYLS